MRLCSSHKPRMQGDGHFATMRKLGKSSGVSSEDQLVYRKSTVVGGGGRKPLNRERRPFKGMTDDKIVEQRRVLLPDGEFLFDLLLFVSPAASISSSAIDENEGFQAGILIAEGGSMNFSRTEHVQAG
ncbi:hypothetical protein HAX54_046775 [Datura stramonium]|uniref:Uncharacterized protein n=1 Tax=Datura stramonium TaxID=4076 RepID=A0ABS8WKB2_DATST|nr:hypothetical protein [Datura stramonium]